jgi:hypothetical protein
LAGRTPEEAVDAFVDRVRATLACILTETVFGSGNAIGHQHSLTLYTGIVPDRDVGVEVDDRQVLVHGRSFPPRHEYGVIIPNGLAPRRRRH